MRVPRVRDNVCRFPGTPLAFRTGTSAFGQHILLWVIREHFTVIRQISDLSLPLSGVVGNPQARDNYLNTRKVLSSPLEKITPLESVEAEISRLTWAVIDGIATTQDRERLAELVSLQHEFRRA
jgi:hypothetical protein